VSKNSASLVSGSAADATAGKSARPTIPDPANLLHAIPDTVVVTDGDGRIIFVNQAVERFFGYSPDQLIGQDVDILVPKKDQSTHMAPSCNLYGKTEAAPDGNWTGPLRGASGRDGVSR